MPNKDEIKGKVEQVKGKVKQEVGKVTGDQDLLTKGSPTKRPARCRKVSAP
jgi:uncharacterized protein YjbJ (UPF0337 family)